MFSAADSLPVVSTLSVENYNVQCILIPEDKSFKPTLRHFKNRFSSSAIGFAKQINPLDGFCSFVAVRPLHAFGHIGTRNKDNNTKHHQYQLRTIYHKQNLNLV